MANILEIKSPASIPAVYKGTPVESLVRYQNFGEPHGKFTQAQLLIGMCIDYRKHLNIPENFAYMIRSAGANLMRNELQVSFAIGVGGVTAIALIGHTQCGMTNLASKKDAFIQGLVDRAGWTAAAAEDHFKQQALFYEIGDESVFVATEAARLRARYPGVFVAPMIYKVEDGMLYQVEEKR